VKMACVVCVSTKFLHTSSVVVCNIPDLPVGWLLLMVVGCCGKGRGERCSVGKIKECLWNTPNARTSSRTVEAKNSELCSRLFLRGQHVE
jgi:hypothetical protein